MKKLKRRKKSKRIGQHGSSLYNEEYCHIAEQACAIGAKNTQLATMFGISQPTINKWMRDNHEFFLAVKNGKDRFDTEFVESALLKRAKGYDHMVVEERVTKEGKIACEKTIHVSPDIGAAIFWLCNRQPQRWKQIAQARFQQMNLYTGNGAGKKDANGKLIVEGEVIDATGVREILGALSEAGAMDGPGTNIPDPKDTGKSKTH